jgi:hypothetical protein
MKLRLSRKIRAPRRRAQIPAQANLSTGLLAQFSARLDESLKRMAFIGICKTKKNANFAQLASNQKDTCKNTISEPLPEAQPS